MHRASVWARLWLMQSRCSQLSAAREGTVAAALLSETGTSTVFHRKVTVRAPGRGVLCFSFSVSFGLVTYPLCPPGICLGSEKSKWREQIEPL